MPSISSPAFSPGKPTQEQRDALCRLLESTTFATAPRLRAVLGYLAQMLEEGKTDQVTEQSIGQDVFGRPVGYNASEDNIVRVTLRHLRNRLEEYYQAEGRQETQVLSIPKGKYIPCFLTRDPSAFPSDNREPEQASTAVEGSTPADEEVLPPVLETALPAETRGRSFLPLPGWVWLVVCAAVLLGFVGGYATWPWIHPVVGKDGVLGTFCHPGENVLVVVVDSNLQVYRSVFGKQVTLENYIDRKYGQEPLNSSDPRVANALHFAMSSSETNVSSAIVASAIKQSLNQRHVQIKLPHDVSMREFQDRGNVVLLGGPWINPWGQLFENRLNFRMLPLPSEPSSSQIHNCNPKQGEVADYIPHLDGNLNVNYVRIAILSNFDRAGRVFLIGATSTEALEAGGNFLIEPDAQSELLKQFHVKSATDLPQLEVLLEVKGLNGVPGSHTIISARPVQ